MEATEEIEDLLHAMGETQVSFTLFLSLSKIFDLFSQNEEVREEQRDEEETYDDQAAQTEEKEDAEEDDKDSVEGSGREAGRQAEHGQEVNDGEEASEVDQDSAELDSNTRGGKAKRTLGHDKHRSNKKATVKGSRRGGSEGEREDNDQSLELGAQSDEIMNESDNERETDRRRRKAKQEHEKEEQNKTKRGREGKKAKETKKVRITE